MDRGPYRLKTDLSTPHITNTIKKICPIGDNPEIENEMRKIFDELVGLDVEQIYRANINILSFANDYDQETNFNDNDTDFNWEVRGEADNLYRDRLSYLYYNRSNFKNSPLSPDTIKLFESIKDDAFTILYTQFFKDVLKIKFYFYWSDLDNFSGHPKSFGNLKDDCALFRSFLINTLNYSKPFWNDGE